MDRTQRRDVLLTLGVIVAAFAGCSEGTVYKSYSPDADAAPPVAVTGASPAAEPSATLPEASTRADEPPAATVAAPVPDAQPDQAASVPESAVEPAEAVDVAAARPEEILPANEPPAGTPAAEPDGTLVAAVGTPAAAVAAAAPLVPKLLVPEKSFKREGDVLRVSYDDIDLLKVLNMEPVTADAPDMFPQWLKDLEGQRIRIRGYMRPGELDKDLPFFVLARDTKDCCFGANSKSYDVIPVIMREGVTTDYIHFRPFDVVGEFHVGVELDFANPERVEFMYRIEDAVVIYKE